MMRLAALLFSSATAITGFARAQTPTTEAIAVWQHKDANWEIYYSILGRSEAGDPASSLAWRATPGPSASAIGALAGDDQNPDVAADRSTSTKKAMAVWEHATGNPTLGRDIYFARYPGGAASGWTVPAALAGFEGNDFDPSIAFDSNGRAVAVWIHQDPDGTNSVQSAFFNGTTWDSPLTITGTSAIDPSLPEVTFTSVTTLPGGSTLHRAVTIWSDENQEGGSDPCDLPIHRMFFSVWDGAAWTGPLLISPSQVCDFDSQTPNTAVAAGSARYPTDTLPAFARAGITADSTGRVFATWGSAATDGCRDGSPGVGAAVLTDIPRRLWSGMCDPDGYSLYARNGAESPDMTTIYAGGDLVGAFDSGCAIREIRSVGGTLTNESTGYQSGNCDFRPSVAAIQDRVIAVNWSEGEAISPSDIMWSAGTVGNPSTQFDSAISWSLPSQVVTGGLSGEDRYPEIASFAGSLRPEICGNAADDDSDGLTDAQDPDCQETCNDADDNGNGFVDESCDNDGDGFCGADKTVTGASTCLGGGGDCDDGDSAHRPGATEVCNGADDDCDGLVDEVCGACADADADGYAICNAGCTLSGGDQCGECNDAVASTHPGATEACNDVDDDCDGIVDEACPTCPDADNDHFAVCGSGCDLATGDQCGDCDEGSGSVHPGATETCGNATDDDCDASIDEGCAPPPTFTLTCAPGVYGLHKLKDLKTKWVFSDKSLPSPTTTQMTSIAGCASSMPASASDGKKLFFPGSQLPAAIQACSGSAPIPASKSAASAITLGFSGQTGGGIPYTASCQIRIWLKPAQ